jgi:hypothetical protein
VWFRARKAEPSAIPLTRFVTFSDQAGFLPQFFFARRPLPLTEEPLGGFTLPVQWPQIPLKELGTYGVVVPRR